MRVGIQCPLVDLWHNYDFASIFQDEFFSFEWYFYFISGIPKITFGFAKQLTFS